LAPAGAAALAVLAAGLLFWAPAREAGSRAIQALPVRLVSADALPGPSKVAAIPAQGAPAESEPRKIRVVTPTSVSLVPESQLPEAAVSISPEEVLYRLGGEDHGRAWASAVNALLAKWNGRMITGSDIAFDVSLAAEESGLRSTRWTGTLPDLTKLNLPALVEVELPGAGARYLALTGYGDKGFTTNLDERAAIPIPALEPIYTGTAYVFWKDQQTFDGELAEGDRGPGVLWVKNVLARLGFYQGPPTDDYDEKLHVAVAALQAAHGLEPDGIVGEQTKMLLHSRIENDASPRLTAVRDGR
jgi:general secretion pathway protein A